MPLEALQHGRYRIVRPLGSGSMGEVYLAEDTRINRQVAIKVVRSDPSPYPDADATLEAARLFEREARAIAQLNHPNILPLFDFGEEQINGAPLTFMVMPYIPDGSLTAWLQQRGTSNLLTPREAAHFLSQAADALQQAHDANIIHQDVKPSNFLIRKRHSGFPDLLLADFGIARLAISTSGMSQSIRGTPVYMAPEQWDGQAVPASDQYALAVMLYQLLTGRAPFQGGMGQIMYQHLHTIPQPPSSLNPSISPAMDDVVLCALSKLPADRFPTVSAFADAFQQAVLALDAPTIARTTNRLTGDHKGISAALAISEAEAHYGSQRILTLPDGHKVTVRVPPGVQNGQVIRVDDPSPGSGAAAEPLLITISIIASPSHPLIAGSDGGGKTIITNPPDLSEREKNTLSDIPTRMHRTSDLLGSNQLPPQMHEAPQFYGSPTDFYPVERPLPSRHVSPPSLAPPVPPAAPASPQPAYQPPRPRRNQRQTPRGLIIALVFLVLLIFVGSFFLVFAINANQTSMSNAHSTATAQSNGATATALAQLNANSTATSAAQSANGTATAQAQTTAQINASATANAQATGTAQVGAFSTATAIAAIAAIAATATATASVTPSPTPTFGVQSVTLSVNPTSIAGIACGTNITVTYTATFVVTSSSGGTVQFNYTINNGKSQTPASITFSPGQTTQTYAFTWSGPLPSDHTYPGAGIVMTTSPNAIISNSAIPSGQCS